MSSNGFLYATLAAVTWGLVYAFDQGVLKGASPLWFLFVSSVITAVLLLPVVFFDRSLLGSLSGISMRVWFFVVASVVLAALANFFIFSSIKLIGSSRASVIEIAYPFFVVIFSYFAFKTTPSIYFLIGAILIFAGAATIIFAG